MTLVPRVSLSPSLSSRIVNVPPAELSQIYYLSSYDFEITTTLSATR